MQEEIQINQDDMPNVRAAGAFILDFITAFFASSYLLSVLAGGSHFMTKQVVLASMTVTIFYFIAGRYVGGTLWQRVAKMK